MVFCLVVLDTTRMSWNSNKAIAPLALGAALFLANLVAMPLTGASINPAVKYRSSTHYQDSI